MCFLLLLRGRDLRGLSGDATKPGQTPLDFPSRKAEGSRFENPQFNACESGLFCLPRAATGLATPDRKAA
jgi:hypothetical protein